jgi:hypothetical protein
VYLAHVLLSPPPWVSGMPVVALLEAAPWAGKVKAERIVREAHIPFDALVGDLSYSSTRRDPGHRARALPTHVGALECVGQSGRGAEIQDAIVSRSLRVSNCSQAITVPQR